MDRLLSHSFLLISILLLCNSLLRSLGAVRCKDGEREALLKFKENLKDDYDLLSSWGQRRRKKEIAVIGLELSAKTDLVNVIALDLTHDSISSSSNFSNALRPWILTGNLMTNLH